MEISRRFQELIRNRDSDSCDVLRDMGGGKGLCDVVGSHPVNGLAETPDDLLKRRKLYGANFIPPPRARMYWEFWLDACRDTTVLILVAAAIVELLVATLYSGESFAEVCILSQTSTHFVEHCNYNLHSGCHECRGNE
jgi:magnesium-transporting ATPase (P-type)